MRRRKGLAVVVVCGALVASAGCKNRNNSEGPKGPNVVEDPGPSSGDEGGPPNLGGSPDSAAVAPEMSGPQPAGPTTRPQDRDPEEEKRKMSLSRDRSKQAVVALRAGDLDKAISESRQALRIHEQNVQAMLVIAEAMYKQGKFEIAQSVCGSALKVDPAIRSDAETAMVHNILGFAYLAENKRGAAMKEFRAAADKDSKNGTAWNNLGVQYMWQGDFKTAESCFKYAVELDPKFVGAILNHGASLRGLGRLTEAEQSFRRALELDNKLAFAHFNLGVLYLDAQTFEQMDIEQRLNKAIVELSRYKELAIASGADRPNPSKAMSNAIGMAALGNELVSPEQADMYIEAAKKGIEREIRRRERDQKRKERDEKRKKEAEAKAKEEAEKPKDEAENAPEGGDEGAPQKPGGDAGGEGAPASPQKPGGKADATAFGGQSATRGWGAA